MLDDDEFWLSAERLADRRELLCRSAPSCPTCKAGQVQLDAFADCPAQWKCRRCKLRFTHEPAEVIEFPKRETT